MDAPALEAARKLLEQLTELKTQQKAQQLLSNRLESVRGALQRAQRRAEEAKVAFTLAQTVKEQADQEAARIQSELCTPEQEARETFCSQHTTPVRVTHTERLVLATVNVKSLKPQELSRSHKYGVDTNSTIDQIQRN